MDCKVTVSITIYSLTAHQSLFKNLNSAESTEGCIYRPFYSQSVDTTFLAPFSKVVGFIMAPTYDTLGKGGPHESGQPQVTDLDRACGASYEDVVTFEVPVNYRRSPSVKEVKALQDLTTPAPQDLRFHHLEAF